jgi:naphtho-gamma-pyrone polyketide synthase
VASILGSISEDTKKSWIPHIPIVANDEHLLYQSDTFQSLMGDILRDIILKSLRWKRVTENCIASVFSAEPEKCQVVPVGAPNATHSLVNALTQQKKCKVSLEHRQSMPTNTTQDSPQTGNLSLSKIAIVGMSGRFPDAASPSAFWELLKQGLDVHREVPKDRFDAQAHYDPTGKRKNTSHTPFGCFVEDLGLFDARFFNMSPKEATQRDPMLRLALLTAYEALEMSGYVPNRTPSTMADRIGTFYGQTSDDWREIQDGQNVQTYFIPGELIAISLLSFVTNQSVH